MSKKLTALLLTLVMVLGMLPTVALADEEPDISLYTTWGQVGQAAAGGQLSGWTAPTVTSNRVSLGSAIDLAWFAYQCNNYTVTSGKTTTYPFRAYTVDLAADIDLGGKEWVPIYNATGTLNGNSSTISNMTIHADISGSAAEDVRVGLFRNFAGNASDLVFVGADIDVTCVTTTLSPCAGVFSGSFAQSVQSKTLSRIGVKNCSVRLASSRYTYVGGVIGRSYSSKNGPNTISACYVVNTSLTSAGYLRNQISGITSAWGDSKLTIRNSLSWGNTMTCETTAEADLLTPISSFIVTGNSFVASGNVAQAVSSPTPLAVRCPYTTATGWEAAYILNGNKFGPDCVWTYTPGEGLGGSDVSWGSSLPGYSVTVNDSLTGGTVAVNAAAGDKAVINGTTTYRPGGTVNLTFTPDEGYAAKVAVARAGGERLPTAGSLADAISFTMPAEDATVDALFLSESGGTASVFPVTVDGGTVVVSSVSGVDTLLGIDHVTVTQKASRVWDVTPVDSSGNGISNLGGATVEVFLPYTRSDYAYLDAYYYNDLGAKTDEKIPSEYTVNYTVNGVEYGSGFVLTVPHFSRIGLGPRSSDAYTATLTADKDAVTVENKEVTFTPAITGGTYAGLSGTLTFDTEKFQVKAPTGNGWTVNADGTASISRLSDEYIQPGDLDTITLVLKTAEYEPIDASSVSFTANFVMRFVDATDPSNVIEKSADKNLAIELVPWEYVSTVTGVNPTSVYDGTDKTLATFNLLNGDPAGTAATYRLSESDEYASSALATAVDEYTVYYKIQAPGYEPKTGTVTARIPGRPIDWELVSRSDGQEGSPSVYATGSPVTAATLQPTDESPLPDNPYDIIVTIQSFTFNGTAGEVDDATNYDADGMPAFTEAGTYVVTYRLSTDDSNYEPVIGDFTFVLKAAIAANDVAVEVISKANGGHDWVDGRNLILVWIAEPAEGETSYVYSYNGTAMYDVSAGYIGAGKAGITARKEGTEQFDNETPENNEGQTTTQALEGFEYLVSKGDYADDPETDENEWDAFLNNANKKVYAFVCDGVADISLIKKAEEGSFAGTIAFDDDVNFDTFKNFLDAITVAGVYNAQEEFAIPDYVSFMLAADVTGDKYVNMADFTLIKTKI